LDDIPSTAVEASRELEAAGSTTSETEGVVGGDAAGGTVGGAAGTGAGDVGVDFQKKFLVPREDLGAYL